MTIIKINDLIVIQPKWNAPSNIKVFSTTRLGGLSRQPFHELNLGLNVGDDRETVVNNRQKLVDLLKLPEPPRWVSQTHSTIVLDAGKIEAIAEADATFTTEQNVVCTVQTADCLPIALTDLNSSFVSVIHAGWRGLLHGIIENTLSAIKSQNHTIVAWLAPAITQKAFEVGPEVYEAFVKSDSEYQKHFIPSDRDNHFYADLYGIAKHKLVSKGVLANNISGGNYCTYSNPNLFFSHRRDNKYSGRQATLIWLAT